MTLAFVNTVYEDNHENVSWRGVELCDCEDLDSYLAGSVRARLDDDEATEDFRGHLRGLELTGMGRVHLEEILSSDASETRDWAAGEALAERFLMDAHSIEFPWNMERDKRNPFGSLPGADLVGFVKRDDGYKLVLGEVKTSSEEKHPPQVMSGRSGHLGHQIDRLAHDFTILCQLLKWLLPRVKSGDYEAAFDEACKEFFNSGKKAVVLFGILVRDTDPDSRDLSGRGTALRKKLDEPTLCDLIAIHLPWGSDQLIAHLRSGGVK